MKRLAALGCRRPRRLLLPWRPHALQAAAVPVTRRKTVLSSLSGLQLAPACRTFGTEATDVTSAKEFATPVVPKTKRDRHFLAALQVFYEHEGHFSVPLDFVVPSPETAKAAEAENDYEKALADADWPPETWGFKLGRQLRLFTRGRCGPYKVALLQTIGFPYDDWKTYVWDEQLLPSLRVFKELYGHLFVRQPFVVPSGDERWPRPTWEFKLGVHAQTLRMNQYDGIPDEQRRALDNLGFLWSDTEWKWKTQYLVALEHFRRFFGHCDVPRHFTVPTNDPLWPEYLWKYRLGKSTQQIRTASEETTLKPRQVAELRALGFYEEDLPQKVWHEAVLPSLNLFPSVHDGSTAIPTTFEVPREALWPEQAWGLQLGYAVKLMNSSLLFVEETQTDRQRLKDVGYDWDVLFSKWTKQLMPALRCFKAKYDHCDVPIYFQVPRDDESWPEVTRGYELGKQIKVLRRSGRTNAAVVDIVGELDAMGFGFNAFESTFLSRVLPAIEVYSKLNGNCNVPQSFIVPVDPAWPRPSWGTKLGHVVRNIRNRQQHAEQVEAHRDRLEQLGFVWRIYKSTAITKREIVQPCLEVYREIHGTEAEVPANFVVPADDSRWPRVAHHFELGAWLHQYKRRTAGLLPCQTPEGKKNLAKASNRKSAVFKAKDADKQELEPHVEAYWRDVLLASFRVYAKQHGSCELMDHSFLVPNEAPYPESAWGLNLGLRLRHIRHGARYAKEAAKYRSELCELGMLLDEHLLEDVSGGDSDGDNEDSDSESDSDSDSDSDDEDEDDDDEEEEEDHKRDKAHLE